MAGYVLSLLIQACLQSQADSPHPDPLHLSAHFLQPTKPSILEVQIRVLKRGRSFVNILAELVQQVGSNSFLAPFLHPDARRTALVSQRI